MVRPFLFHLPDMPRHGRLGDEQFFRRSGEAQAAGDCLEHFQPEIRNHDVWQFIEENAG